MKFFEELKRRNVIKATIAYIVVAWVLLQVTSIILPIVGAPEWVLKILTFFIGIGLPIWIIFSWVYEVTPEGLKKTAKVSEEKSITAATNKRLNIIIIITLIIAIGISFINKSRTNSSLNSMSTNDLKIDNSIAVLPFVNMSKDQEQECSCDGITENIIATLAQTQQLIVVARNATFAYKGKSTDVRQIGQELGAIP